MEHKHHHTINVERAFSYRFGGSSVPQSPQDNTESFMINWQALTDVHDQFFVGTMFAHEHMGRNERLEQIYQSELAKLIDAAQAQNHEAVPTEEQWLAAQATATVQAEQLANLYEVISIGERFRHEAQAAFCANQ